MLMFSYVSEIIRARRTKGDLARGLYPDEEYNVDCAIPDSWLSDAYARGMDLYCKGTHLPGHFVTVYPRDGSPMFIAPLTTEGVLILARLATVK